MAKKVLITGGSGFIGSHLADRLLTHGYEVRVLDALLPQVHGEGQRPEYLADDVELIQGDVQDPDAVQRALAGVEVVFHLAAAVGVGQSMYEIAYYTRVNNLGTAVLLEALAKHPVERLVVASSMSIYGEGLYRSSDGNLYADIERSTEQLKRKQWELFGDQGEVLSPLPTPESKRPALASVYALSKYDQERLCLIFGQAYGVPTLALRFFNVYGTRQALSNPYTGIIAIFSSRLLNNKPPLIYEDGLQSRDFVSVYDIAQACVLAMEVPEAVGQVFNVGGGQPTTVLEMAHRIAHALGKESIEPEIAATYRAGDIRHCFADISRAQQVLGYEPQVKLEEGIVELASWLENQVAIDHVSQAHAELSSRGLVG